MTTWCISEEKYKYIFWLYLSIMFNKTLLPMHCVYGYMHQSLILQEYNAVLVKM